jgi:hypothetical protein
MFEVLDGPSLLGQMGKIVSLMPQAEFLDHLQIWSRPLWFGALPLRHLQIQGGQVPARKVISQVRCC